MPGLIRGVARTAVVAGTATAVSNRVSRRQAGRWADQDQQQYEHEQYVQQQQYAQQQQQYPPQGYPQQGYPQQGYPPPQPEPAAAPAPAAPDMSATIAQLQQLAELKGQGILTDEEFERQKSKLLGT